MTTVDERGRAAADAVRAEVDAWIAREAASSIGIAELTPTANSHRQRTRIALAACAILVVTALLGVLLVTHDDGRPGVATGTSEPERDPPYAFVPTSLPNGMRPVTYVPRDLVTDSQSRDPSKPMTDSPPAYVTYARNYGDVPSIGVGIGNDRRGRLSGRVTRDRVRGHPAKISGFAHRFLGPQYSLVWRERGKYYRVFGEGLSRSELVEVAQHLRPVSADELQKHVRGVHMPPWFYSDPRSGPVRPTPITTLASIDRPDGIPIELRLTTRTSADDSTWTCAEATRMGAASLDCADPKFGFTVPLVLDAILKDVAVENPRVDPREQFVVMSLPPSHTLTVELADGTVLDADTYDTDEGRHPVLAFVDIGAHLDYPKGAVVVRNRHGEVVDRWRFVQRR